jgi:hypothetical protein
MMPYIRISSYYYFIMIDIRKLSSSLVLRIHLTSLIFFLWFIVALKIGYSSKLN